MTHAWPAAPGSARRTGRAAPRSATAGWCCSSPARTIGQAAAMISGLKKVWTHRFHANRVSIQRAATTTGQEQDEVGRRAHHQRRGIVGVRHGRARHAQDLGARATTVPSAVPLVMAMVRLVSGGMVSRSACGSTTFIRVWPKREAGRARGLPLALVHRGDAGPEDLLGEGHQHQRERQPGRDEARGRDVGGRQAEIDQHDDHQRRQRAEQVDDEDDQPVERPDAEAAQQRQREAGQRGR